MKRVLISLAIISSFVLANAQSTAPKISVTDCNSVENDLYKKLDEGKIIVIGWTMPCGACAGPLLEVHNAVLNFSLSHPNTVEYWLNDDYGNTTCATISSWCKTNGINSATYFSSAALSMNDFGSTGMPKVVIIGCNNGTVYYNVDDTPTGSGATAAMNKAWQDMENGCKTAEINEVTKNAILLSPVPVKNNLNVSIQKNNFDANSIFSITNILGEIVLASSFKDLIIKKGELNIDVSELKLGVYFFNITNSKGAYTKKFIKN